jgi:uncharacterized protein involved in exopolysaccharide biosynthesis
VQPYLSTARRFRWLLVAILIVVWGSGIAAAWLENSTTYTSEATVWVIRPSPELNIGGADDPNVALIQTAASQQAEVLKQLLLTRSVLADVVVRTSLRPELETAPDQSRYLDGVRKRFRVETLGTSLLRISYSAHDPQTPPELVRAALAVRAERLAQARLASAAALSTLYQREMELAEAQAKTAQKTLDEFMQSHKPPLSDADQHRQSQLMFNLDSVLFRLGDLQGKADRAQFAPAALEVSGVEFQVVDEPRVESSPSGGERAALVIAFVSFAAGGALVTLLTLAGTLLNRRSSVPTVADRVVPARPFGTLARPNDAETA